tara:strand:- start:91 stop:531 length:441 start_codon:yes stop_codon:yes gene_type:complete
MISLQTINEFDNKFKLSDELIKKSIADIISLESQYINSNISIIIVDDEYLRNLKIKYFNMDILTDVVTFNLSDNDENLDAEIYISFDRVVDNAKKFNVNIDEELKRVIIHGCLHLVGFDDSTQDEKKVMRDKENKYIDKIKESIII